jgi:6-phosphofructokinase
MVTAQQLQEAGIDCIGVPKMIDNDLEATATTFGFDSAVDVAVDALDRLHTTATSHRRVMVVEVMGRHAGWIALHGGVAGGADVILIPEIPFDYDKIAGVIKLRESAGYLGTVVVVAEGARPRHGEQVKREVDGGRISSRWDWRNCSARNCQAHWQGNALLRARASPARRRAYDIGQNSRHAFRRKGCAISKRRSLRFDGQLRKLSGAPRANRRSRQSS